MVLVKSAYISHLLWRTLCHALSGPIHQNNEKRRPELFSMVTAASFPCTHSIRISLNKMKCPSHSPRDYLSLLSGSVNPGVNVATHPASLQNLLQPSKSVLKSKPFTES